ncbi:MAG TPA: cytochrome c oxidase subunit II [Candidatus Polarisedimenticolia bacterium]|nr:cytochrome c oxidase subunit II [Candidatus Polarisedimenticolia bacterium]
MLSWLPENVSTYGAEIDRLFYLIYYITSISCVLVLAGLLYFIVKYRARKGGRAIYSHGNSTLEIIWTIVPALVFVMLGFMSRSVWGEIRYRLPETDLRVKVTGSQFNWQMTYPGVDGRLGTPDDLNEENRLHVPVDREVRVVLASKDVIHSFFLPNLRLKQDAVPGREIEVWFRATKTGRYEIPCAELCGFGHSNMKGELLVQAPEEFTAWAREKKAFP